MIKNISIENRWIGLLLLFYFFGLIGISIDAYKSLFLPLTPFNLILTLFVFYKVNQDFSPKLFILSILIFLIGYSIETIGVATGVLFGSYTYGASFGFKILDTPLVIGINWLFLALSSYGVILFFTKKAVWLIVLPPVLMTSLDVLVEPVAMKLGFWSWANDIIPLQNYVMWYLTSIVIHVLICFFRPNINAKISFTIIGVQVSFFGTLNIIL
jgi:putative membrane protein